MVNTASKLGALLQTQMLLVVSSLCGVFTFTLVFQSTSDALSFACRCGRENGTSCTLPILQGFTFSGELSLAPKMQVFLCRDGAQKCSLSTLPAMPVFKAC